MADLSNSAFEVMRSAVNIARNEQIRTVDALKKRLLDFYPSRETDVDNAISTWARYAQANR